MSWITRTKVFNQFSMFTAVDMVENFDDNVTNTYFIEGSDFLIGSNQGSNTRFTLDGTTTPTADIGFQVTIGGSDRVDSPLHLRIGRRNITIFQSSGSLLQSFRLFRGHQ